MGWENDFQTVITLPTGATTGERIVIDGTNGTITAYYADDNIAWVGEVEGVNGLLSFSDDDPSTVQSSGLVNGAVLLSTGDLRLFTVPTFGITMFGPTDGSGSFFCADAAGNTGALVIAPTNTAFTLAAAFPGQLTWQTPALGAGWQFTSIRGALPLRYRIDAEDNLVIKGSVSCTTTTPAGTVFSVVAPYLPIGVYGLQQGLMMKQAAAGTGFVIGHGFISAGAVQQNGFTFTVGDILSFDFTWPLGHIA